MDSVSSYVNTRRPSVGVHYSVEMRIRAEFQKNIRHFNKQFIEANSLLMTGLHCGRGPAWWLSNLTK